MEKTQIKNNRVILSREMLNTLSDIPRYTRSFPTIPQKILVVVTNFIFIELFSRSPIFYSFLKTTNRYPDEIIRDLRYYPDSENTQNKIKYTSGVGKLEIHLSDVIVTQALALLEKRARKIWTNNTLNEVVSGLGVSTTIHKLNFPIQKYEIDSEKDFKDLLEFVSKSLLDAILANVPRFTELSASLKARIVAYQSNEIDVDEVLDETKLEKLFKIQTDKKIAEAEQALSSKNNNITEYTSTLQRMISEREEILDSLTKLKMGGPEKDTNLVKRLTKVLKNPVIQNIEISNTNIILTTNPIVVNYDKAKTRALPPKLVESAEKGLNFGIGRHTIKIRLNNLGLIFKPLDKYKNHHVEDYNCYGSFAEHITNARKSGDIPQLINLAIQILSRVTVGDPAGTTTLNRAYLIDDNQVVHIDKQKIHIKEFINNIAKGENKNEYYTISS